ncbi:MAG: Monophosphatase/phosphodiesterase bifunctional enzyme [Bifidobacterium crudilactis]|jgi:myo-inositol-1(or 4)-monophosphatase|uniref:inositol monophosphatase family protein n=1 Tax=Bifidobacterium crudilactis TaxID=327277 RepID=UPI003A5BE061
MTGSIIRFAAHRGVHEAQSGVRENTLASIRAAIAAKADLVEIDVRLTADGQTVILHDPNLLRVWGDSRLVENVTVKDLRKGPVDPDMCVPTLAEALDVIHDSGSKLLIDMDDERFAVPAFETVQTMGMCGEVEWCGKFQAMSLIRAHDPHAVIWMPWRHSTPPQASDLDVLRPQVINAPYLVVGPDLVRGIHELGMSIFCWTVDDGRQAAHMFRMGVDGITTNSLEDIRQSVRLADPDVEESQDEHDARAHYIVGEIAKAAADLVQESNGEYRTHVHGKATPADLVTDLDQLIERQVREALYAQFPEIPVVGEEMGGDEPERGDCWFLDPLDGSINFANGLPWFSFSLALVRDGDKPIVGAVIDPAGWRVITARSGEGAWVDGRRVSIPERVFEDDDDPVKGTIVSVELANNAAWPGLKGIFDSLSERFCTMRVQGSGTASVSGVALGRGVATMVGKFGPVDHFAAVLIVHEAGGVVVDLRGDETLSPRNRGFLAARDRHCAEALVAVWQESLRG